MNRRAFLSAIGATGAASGLAGCLDAVAGDGDTTERLTPVSVTSDSGAADAPADGGQTDTPSYDTSIAAQGIPPNICSEAIQPEPGIYAIDEVATAPDWTSHDIPFRYHTAMDEDQTDIAPEHNVVGLTTEDGRARAYPLEVLAEHEIVNDDFGGPVIVTFCPICRSGMVAEARVRGTATTFLVSGLLWQPERLRVADAEVDNRTFGAERTGGELVGVRHGGNLVMYDLETGSYWSQILARSICGPETGEYLTIRPSTLTTWGEWQREHPNTDVVLPKPHSETNRPGELAGQTPMPPDS